LGYGAIRNQTKNEAAGRGGLARLSRAALSSILSNPYSAVATATATSEQDVSTTASEKVGLLIFAISVLPSLVVKIE
jgi:hypothetical protein